MTGNINCITDITLSEEILEVIINHGMEGLPRAIEILYNEAMKIERIATGVQTMQMATSPRLSIVV